MKVFCLDGPYKNEVLSDVPNECRRTREFIVVGDHQVKAGDHQVSYNDFIKPTRYYLHTIVDSSKIHYVASIRSIIPTESIIERLVEAIELPPAGLPDPQPSSE